jgi:hypothetical protein
MIAVAILVADAKRRLPAARLRAFERLAGEHVPSLR